MWHSLSSGRSDATSKLVWCSTPYYGANVVQDADDYSPSLFVENVVKRTGSGFLIPGSQSWAGLAGYSSPPSAFVSSPLTA